MSDNLKAGVFKACRYDPDVNPAYQELAEHYSVAVIPARVKKSQGQSESGGCGSKCRKMDSGPLAGQEVFLLRRTQRAMAELVELNDQVMRAYGKSRRELFELWIRPELKLLARTDYELATWKKVRVNLDYHIEVDRHYYSRFLHPDAQDGGLQVHQQFDGGLPLERVWPRIQGAVFHTCIQRCLRKCQGHFKRRLTAQAAKSGSGPEALGRPLWP